MAKLTIRCFGDYYQLVCGRDESDETEYGDPAILESGNKCYLAHIHEDDNGERVSLLNNGDDWAVEVRKSVAVEFEDATDSDGDGDGEGEGDGEETEIESELEEPDADDDDNDDDAGDDDPDYDDAS